MILLGQTNSIVRPIKQQMPSVPTFNIGLLDQTNNIAGPNKFAELNKQYCWTKRTILLDRTNIKTATNLKIWCGIVYPSQSFRIKKYFLIKKCLSLNHVNKEISSTSCINNLQILLLCVHFSYSLLYSPLIW